MKELQVIIYVRLSMTTKRWAMWSPKVCGEQSLKSGGLENGGPRKMTVRMQLLCNSSLSDDSIPACKMVVLIPIEW